MSDKVTTKRNRKVEQFILQDLEIEPMFALAQFCRYEQEVEAAQNGHGFYELGVKERWRQQMPSLIAKDVAFTKTLHSSWAYYESDTPEGSIIRIPISGVMQSHGGASSRGADSVVADLRAAYSNRNVAGVILEITSGGGESMAGTMIASAVKERNKPVVTLANMAASAAYRVAAATDEVIAAGESAEFGSIGTMITIDNELIAEYREKMSEFYGNDAPEKNDEWRALLAGDAAKIQERVNVMTQRFHAQIKEDRELKGDENEVKKTLSGAMFSTAQAKRRGLVDLTGDITTATRRVFALQSKYK